MGHIEDLQAKGFGSHGGRQHIHHGHIQPLGKRVLVLEQHYIAGGCTHSFDEHGVEHETGIHYVGNIEKRKKILNHQKGWLRHLTRYLLMIPHRQIFLKTCMTSLSMMKDGIALDLSILIRRSLRT